MSNEKYAHIWEDASSSSTKVEASAGKCLSEKAVKAANLALTMMDASAPSFQCFKAWVGDFTC